MDERGEDIDRGRFACAVVSEKSENFSMLDRQIDLSQHRIGIVTVR